MIPSPHRALLNRPTPTTTVSVPSRRKSSHVRFIIHVCKVSERLDEATADEGPQDRHRRNWTASLLRNRRKGKGSPSQVGLVTLQGRDKGPWCARSDPLSHPCAVKAVALYRDAMLGRPRSARSTFRPEATEALLCAGSSTWGPKI